MTIAITGGLITEPAALSANTVTTVFTARSRTMIVSVVACPTSGTPNLSLSRYNGTTRYYFRKAVAMTAGTPYVWETPFMIDAGDMDVMVTYLMPFATGVVRGTT
jgi:hypothetical protein